MKRDFESIQFGIRQPMPTILLPPKPPTMAPFFTAPNTREGASNKMPL
jgi:hypothetical protein